MFEDGIFLRDIALAIILLGFAGLALMRPWLGVLGLAVLSFLHPQAYAPGFMKHFPAYASLFAVVVAGSVLAFARGRLSTLPPRLLLRDWRVFALPGLWLWFAVTSHYALVPPDAWARYQEILRILPPLALALLLIDERRKLHALIVTVALSIMLIAFKGGYWAVMTGFQDRVYGPPGTQFGDNNHFAVAVCMTIPLLGLWLRETHGHMARALILLGIALCYGAALSSWSRGGMLALAAVTLLLVLQTRRKWLWIPALLVLASALFTLLPESWFGRMQTLGSYASDQSAQSRLTAWRIGFDLAMHRPITGGGFNAWPVLTLDQGDMDWHSVYVKMAAEHGFVGLAWWATLLLGSMLHLARAAWRPAPGYPEWASDYSAMLLASLLAYMIGGATVGIAYWELPYLLVAMAILIRMLARTEMAMTVEGGATTDTTVGNFYRSSHARPSKRLSI